MVKPNLTPREQDILTLLVRGASKKQVMNLRHIELSTVDTHLAGIRKKLKVNSHAGIVLRAVQLQLVPLREVGAYLAPMGGDNGLR